MASRATTSPRRARIRRAATWLLVVAATVLFCEPTHAEQQLGLNVHQSTSFGLDITRDAGLRWVRIDLNWFNAQPSENKPPSFDLFDTIVDEALSRGLSVLAVIGYGPQWASSGDTKDDGHINDVPKGATYAAFVTATVEHFKDRVTHYELWNEPNLGDFFEGTPEQYVQTVLLPGADALHAACPSCKVVGPGLATVGGAYDVWMDAALSAAKDRIDIVSGHVYADFHQDKLSDNFFNKLEQHRTVEIGGTVVYVGPLSLREVMQQHGVTAPFWLTETGQTATYGDGAQEQEQLLYYRHVLEAMLTRPWWTTTIFYEAFDIADSGHTWGVALVDEQAPGGYRPKAVMALLKKAVSSQPAFGGNGSDCNDGLDNEGDGLVDYPLDPDCASALGKSEGDPPLDPPDGGAGGGSVGSDKADAPASDPSCGCRVTGERNQPQAFVLLLVAFAVGSSVRRGYRPRRR